MHITHILHIILHIGYILICILSCILCILSNMHIVHIKHIVICILCILCIFWIKKVIIRGFHRLLPLLLGPPSQGPAVYVPPPTTITTVCWFIAESSGKVSRFKFSSHGEGYCPGRTRRNKRKASQYGGCWNHIQNLCLFTAFVDDCRLTLIQSGWGR